MELTGLRHFQAVARHEHVGRAAEELLVAQPSLSRSLARLERELGVSLFDRVGRRVRLNAYGAAALRRVDRALAELEALRLELADLAGVEGGRVRVGTETVLTLTGVLRDFLIDHPRVEVRLVQASAPGMTELLAGGDLDVCLASQDLVGSGFAVRHLSDEEVLLAVPPGHRLAGLTGVRMSDLVEEPVVSTRPGYWQRTVADALFAEVGARPRVVCEGDEPGVTQDLVAAGLGVALLPAIARAAGGRAEVAWVRLDHPRCRRRLTAVWRDDVYPSSVTLSFVDALTAWFAPGPASGRATSVAP